MPIDWFTVTAQVLNFVVLVWLLKRFLYGPLLAAIDAREERVAAELADAAAKQTQALAERDDFARRNADFDAQRSQQLAAVQAQVAQERQHLLAQAHQAANDWSARRQALLLAQAQQLDQTIRVHAQQEIFAITRKTLEDLAATDLEQQVCRVFVRRLRATDAGQLEQLRAALHSGAEPVLLRSAFALSSDMRETIQDAVNTLAPEPVVLQFAINSELVAGIELICGGHKIGWNIADYLDAMAEQVEDLLQTPPSSPSPPREAALAQPAPAPTAQT